MEPINSGGESTGRLVAIPPDLNQALALDKLRLHRARKAARMEGNVSATEVYGDTDRWAVRRAWDRRTCYTS